jgi:hypothetical protein
LDVKQRLGKSGIVDETKYLRYTPKNLPKDVDFTEPTQLERDYIEMCRGDPAHKRRGACAICREMAPDQGWLDRWRNRRVRRLREQWAKDLATPV